VSETPIAWPALETGTTVYSSDGEEIGAVDEVVADLEKDIFSGIVINPGLLKDKIYAPADAVATITQDQVMLSLTAAEAERDLAPPE
jgi:uncharacterized protein YrrD